MPTTFKAADLAALQYFKQKQDTENASRFAPKNNAALTGVPTAPTAASGTNTNQIATTAFVNNELDDKIPQNVSELTNDTGYITGVDWNDITNKPTNFSSEILFFK